MSSDDGIEMTHHGKPSEVMVHGIDKNSDEELQVGHSKSGSQNPSAPTGHLDVSKAISPLLQLCR